MKIKTLTLNNFRAFPGPAPQSIHLEGKNLLVYGENGAGKSTIYHALRGFFSLDASEIADQRNVFVPAVDPYVEVTFDQFSARWAPSLHPSAESSGRVRQAALRSAHLDYRSLLDTNFIHQGNEINLFDLAVRVLLTEDGLGGRTSIADDWKKVERKIPKQHYPDQIREVDKEVLRFNEVFRERMEGTPNRSGLNEVVRTLLAELLEGEQLLEKLEFRRAYYDKGRRMLDGALVPIINYRGYKPSRPQLFLNEARLSALGLAIFLGGRLTSVPSGSNDLKLLVLDDVLLGIDQSNRLPLLRLLEKRFSDWQIILLTHDHVLFEMARYEITETGDWRCIEIYEGKQEIFDANGEVVTFIPCPYIQDATDLELPRCLLTTASKFLDEGYLPAAANYARAAYEAALKTTCHRFGIPVPYNIEPRQIKSDQYLGAIKRWLEEIGQYKHFHEVVVRVEFFRHIVLNPYSHSLPWTLTKSEIVRAMRAIEGLMAVDKANADKNPSRIEMARLVTALDNVKYLHRTRMKAGILPC
jgi:energy-coupling factor transporter ATP-binding protein EcfA2